jgi:hypothetical protein
MSHSSSQIRVRCLACPWIGVRTPKHEGDGGFGRCPKCAGALKRRFLKLPGSNKLAQGIQVTR